jgi:hypothetical protein
MDLVFGGFAADKISVVDKYYLIGLIVFRYPRYKIG